MQKHLINKGGEQISDWNEMWSRIDLFSKIINCGRWFYNLFFRRFLLKHIKNDSSMIELGCGGSTLTLSIIDHLDSLCGVDNSPIAINISQKHAARLKLSAKAKFIHANIFNLPKNLIENFDLAWSQGLMEHFDNYEAVIFAHIQTIKPGGTMIISVPYKYSYIYLWYFLTGNKLLKKFWPYAEQKFLTKKELIILGKKFSNDYKVYFLPPTPLGFILGIITLEIPKPAPKKDYIGK